MSKLAEVKQLHDLKKSDLRAHFKSAYKAYKDRLDDQTDYILVIHKPTNEESAHLITGGYNRFELVGLLEMIKLIIMADDDE